ncbi:hypothetical protein QR79_31900, partial [Methylobacterium indicum]
MHGSLNVEITAEILLKAYAAGIFPMAEDADDPTLYWVEPKERGILPLDRFHLGQRLARIDLDGVAMAEIEQLAVEGADAGVDPGAVAIAPRGG